MSLRDEGCLRFHLGRLPLHAPSLGVVPTCFFSDRVTMLVALSWKPPSSLLYGSLRPFVSLKQAG